MAATPQELIDSIICEVDDVKSLKACALTAHSFRNPSQRQLLHSLTLQLRDASIGSHTPSPNYAEFCTLLEESPHVAVYIKRLTIRLYYHTSRGQWKKLQTVLGKLGNVRWCKFGGHYNRIVWNELTSEMCAAFTDFFARQPLRELHMYRISGIPPAVFLGSLEKRGADMLSGPYPGSSPEKVSGEDVSTSLPLYLPSMRDLILDIATEDIYTLLVLPEFISHVAALRRVSIDPQYGHTKILIQAAADTLEHIHFSCMHYEAIMEASIVLPHLPALRFLEAYIGFPTHHVTFLLDTISSILTSNTSPRLAEIVLTFRFVNWEFQLPSVPDPQAMAKLDTVLVEHPAEPIIRWRMNFTLDYAAAHLAAFTDIVRDGMPKTRDLGKLSIEEYRDADEYTDQWPLRRP
ncbi:hypothetical protein B0H11DRAFT_45646 [Mycena galericulata]|nr:hypothetical protein B0H11DRAFT_45646 [Mycena galericulata]